jgi:hypothetical protein
MLIDSKTLLISNFENAPWVLASAGTNGRVREAQPKTPFIPAEAGMKSSRGRQGRMV